MKLVLCCSYCRRKINLASNSRTRSQLASQWGTNFTLRCPHCSNSRQYSVNEVFAEKSSQGNTLPVAVIGGLVGLLGGPAGVVAGGAIGGIIGNQADERELRDIRIFNNSSSLNS